jgi:histidyl-tRNA synthetase
VQGRSGLVAPRAEPLLSDIGLRYDLTVPLARVYAAHQGALPPVFKRYQIQPVWRADTPGKGRFREFYQCDVDVIGSSSLLVEAEVTAAAAECMQRLGFAEFELRCNHRGLLRAMIEHAGIDVALEGSAITAIDKLDKIGRDGVSRELRERGVSAESEQKLLSLLGERAELAHIKHSLAGSEAGSRAIAELERVLALAQSTPAAAHLRFDATLARGLGYYTGCIFEIAVGDFAGSLGGGGRYDNLIGMFSGKQVPACGLALGLERLLVVMADRGMYPAELAALDMLLAAAEPAQLDAALCLAQRLRAAGLRVDLLPDATSPGKLRKQAEARAVGAAVWLEADHDDRCSVWTKADGQTHRDLTAEALIDGQTRPHRPHGPR